MTYRATITSKGTITIPAPIRKALRIKPGQKINFELDEENNRVLMDTDVTVEEFERVRDEILSKYPKQKALTGRALKEAIAQAWVSDHR